MNQIGFYLGRVRPPPGATIALFSLMTSLSIWFCASVLMEISHLIAYALSLYVYWAISGAVIITAILHSRRRGILADAMHAPFGEQVFLFHVLVKKLLVPVSIGLVALCALILTAQYFILGLGGDKNLVLTLAETQHFLGNVAFLLTYVMLLVTSLAAASIFSIFTSSYQPTGSQEIPFPIDDHAAGCNVDSRKTKGLTQKYWIVVMATCSVMPLPYGFMILLIDQDYFYFLTVLVATMTNVGFVSWFLFASLEKGLISDPE